MLGGPAFALINLKHTWAVALGQFIFALSVGTFGGNMPVFLVTQVSELIAWLCLF